MSFFFLNVNVLNVEARILFVRVYLRRREDPPYLNMNLPGGQTLSVGGMYHICGLQATNKRITINAIGSDLKVNMVSLIHGTGNHASILFS